jgi:hypothetical protein
VAMCLTLLSVNSLACGASRRRCWLLVLAAVTYDGRFYGVGLETSAFLNSRGQFMLVHKERNRQ